MFAYIRRILFGAPLPTSRQSHERLNKALALPVFASDAISSVAYATEEILTVLLVLGAVAWTYSIPIALGIGFLLVVVVTSYRLTILSYPQGGGSYIVSKENLGTIPGLVAAAALLNGYIVTVAVSIAAGVAAIVSAYPELAPYRVHLGVVAIAFVALANLRGVRESGKMFALPTYLFVSMLLFTILTGIYKYATGDVTPVVSPDKELPVVGALSVFLIMRAFAMGCSAMTGTEAIADGVPAFRAPEAKNAAATLAWMAAILVTLFLGITFLANIYRVLPASGGHGGHGAETVVSQVIRAIFGTGPFYYLAQYATAMILILAANTAYQDFPRLSSILARDRYMPRQMASIGDRLVFNNGILALSGFAMLLVILFQGDTGSLIPLYAVGVFLAFTLSQLGMFTRLKRLKPPKWRFFSSVSGFGAFMTALVTVIAAYANFVYGAWIVLVIIPALVLMFQKINQHYVQLGNQLRLYEDGSHKLPEIKSTSIVLVAGVHKGVIPALEYAKSLSHDCRALHIEIDPNDTPLVRDRWDVYGKNVPLVILESPYRSVLGPVLHYLEEAKKERPDHIVTVVLPEFVPKKWWHKALHGQSGFFLKVALMFKRDIVVTNVRYYLEK